MGIMRAVFTGVTLGTLFCLVAFFVVIGAGI